MDWPTQGRLKRARVNQPVAATHPPHRFELLGQLLIDGRQGLGVTWVRGGRGGRAWPRPGQRYAQTPALSAPPETQTPPLQTKVRLGEKEALDSFLGWLEARAGQLPRLEYYQERRLKRLGLIDDNGDTTYSSFFKVGWGGPGFCFWGFSRLRPQPWFVGLIDG